RVAPTTAATATLSLHDALPISPVARRLRHAVAAVHEHDGGKRAAAVGPRLVGRNAEGLAGGGVGEGQRGRATREEDRGGKRRPRSEEHTSELQSRGHLVCRLLL